MEIYETVAEYEATRASLPSKTFDAVKGWPEGLPGYESSRPLADLRKGAELKCAERVENEPKAQFHPICTTFSNYIPVVPCSSQNNESVSLANRALMKVPEPDADIWADFDLFSRQYIEEFEPIPCDKEGNFLLWNSNFDANKQKKHLVAWESLIETPLEDKDFLRSHFVKRELTMKGGEHPEEFDPRAIQANTDRLNVSLGPFISLGAKQLKERWSADKRICYTAGMTAEEIGAWRAQFGERNVTIIECDESRYDAHQGAGVYNMTGRLCKKMGIENHGDSAYALTSMKRIAGWSSHGVKYGVKYTMTSGSPTTSFANSFLNGVKTAYALSKCGITDYKMLVHGDDSIIVIEGHLTIVQTSFLRTTFLGIQKALGFTTKMKIATEWPLVEYCSSLFWPVEGGFVLGPKIGKRLPKIGFSLNKLAQGEVKGMLTGLNVEAGFVPVIRVYAQHQLALLNGCETKHYTDKRSVYKSLASREHKFNEDTSYFFLVRYGFDVLTAERALKAVLTNNLTDCVNYAMLVLFTAIDL